MMTFKYPYSFSVAALIIILLPGLSSGTELNYELRAGGTYSDNISRVATGEVDETVALVGLNFDLSNESRRFEGSLAGDIEYRDYLDSTFSNETYSSVDARALFKLLPDVFDWTVEDRFGVIEQVPFAADTPDNRENVNVFSTGPNIKLRLGGKTSMDLEARYHDTNYEISRSDNSTISGSLSLVRAMSANRAASLNVSSEKIEYDNAAVGSDFDRRAAYFGFSSRTSRSSLNLSLGVNELRERDNSGSGTYAAVSWNRKISEASTISLAFSQKYSDAGDIFRRFENFDSQSGVTSNIIPTDDPFETQEFSSTYDFARNTFRFSVTGLYSDDNYQNDTSFDSKRIGGNANVSRSFGGGWAAKADFRIEKRDFDILNRSDDYVDAGLYVDRQLSRRFSLSLGYIYADRSSDESGEDYSENQYTLLFFFNPQR